MIHCTYHHFSILPNQQEFESLLNQLPSNLHEAICKYHQPIDRYTRLMGKLMLASHLGFFRLGKERLQEIQKTHYGKPYLPDITFTISHSHQMVVCASSVTTDWLGIDTEHIRELDIDFAKKCFSETEWTTIQAEKLRFFDYWAQKEAFMKADGRGMSLPPIQIQLNGNYARTTDQERRLHKIAVHADYATWLCTDLPSPEITISPFPQSSH